MSFALFVVRMVSRLCDALINSLVKSDIYHEGHEEHEVRSNGFKLLDLNSSSQSIEMKVLNFTFFVSFALFVVRKISRLCDALVNSLVKSDIYHEGHEEREEEQF